MMNIFAKVGVPLQLLSDSGPEFESELFSELMKSMDIDKLRLFAYKPSTNGIVERFYSTLNSVLRKVESESQREWDRNLLTVLAADEAPIHNATGYSPDHLFLVRGAFMPVDLVLEVPEDNKAVRRTHDQYVES